MVGRHSILNIEAELAATSETPTPARIAPYTECLLVHEWKVLTSESKTLTARQRVRVAHWGILKLALQPASGWKVGERHALKLQPFNPQGKEGTLYTSDTLPQDLAAPFYLDDPAGRLTQVVDDKYVLAEEMFAKGLDRCEHVKLIVVSDCRWRSGIPDLTGDANRACIEGLNLTVATAFFPVHDYLIRKSIRTYPSLKWVVWVIAPQFVAAMGQEVLDHPPWPDLEGSKEKPAQAGRAFDVRIPTSPDRSSHSSAGVREEFRQRFTKNVCIPDLQAWYLFEGVVRELNRRDVNVLAFVHLGQQFNRDGLDKNMRHEYYPALVERLAAMTALYPNFHFVKRSDATHGLFGRNAKGSDPTAVLSRYLQAHDRKPVPLTSDDTPVEKIGRVDPGQRATPQALEAKLELIRQVNNDAALLLVGGREAARFDATALGAVNLAFEGATTVESEGLVRGAVAAGKRIKWVLWDIQPHTVAARQGEDRIQALQGPAWPYQKDRIVPPEAPAPIVLGPGVTCARATREWELSLERWLLFENAVRELAKRDVKVLALGLPSSVKSYSTAVHAALADRLQAMTLAYPNCFHLPPQAFAAGKPESLQTIKALLDAPEGRGRMNSDIAPPTGNE